VVGVFVYAVSMHADALVIRTVPTREHDRVAVLYTRQTGKLMAVARGSQRARSRQAPAIDTGNIIRCELVPGRSMPIIAGAHAVRCFSDAKRSTIRWAAAHGILQAADAVIFDGQQDEGLWNTLTGALDALDTALDAEAISVFRRWQAHLLEVLGYGAPVTHAGLAAVRSVLDERFEQIAGRRLGSLDLLYRLAEGRF
jgi:DNA repair protein RecO (recombination protein O)